ncbi:MAG: hypothetical protein KC478_12695, partial [Bacteriovoracaceae bacterium]|nr:hypothetical protein [Bacteriovoracaceae bacterium]
MLKNSKSFFSSVFITLSVLVVGNLILNSSYNDGPGDSTKEKTTQTYKFHKGSVSKSIEKSKSSKTAKVKNKKSKKSKKEKLLNKKSTLLAKKQAPKTPGNLPKFAANSADFTFDPQKVGESSETANGNSNNSEDPTVLSGTTTFTSNSSPKVKGKVPPLEGLVTKTSTNAFNAYAASCINPSIQVFDVTTMSVLADNPITQDGLTSSTSFDFDVDDLELDKAYPTRYILRVTGCDQKYERIVTSYFKDQNITSGSTLMTKILKTSAEVNYT